MSETPGYGVEQLDWKEPGQRLLYERAFYEAYHNIKGNRLIQNLWIWDHEERRLRTRIPYEDQEIFVIRYPNGELEAAISANMTLNGFQAGTFGFKPPQRSENYTEILQMFSKKTGLLRNRMVLAEVTRNLFKERGFRYSFATCAPRVLPIYLRMKARVVEETIIEGEGRYLLEFDLNRKLYRGVE